MGKPIKAALLSAFVFPGMGHFSLKRHVSGIVVAGTAAGSLYFYISELMATILPIAEKAAMQGVQLDIMAISELVSEESAALNAPFLDYAWTIFVIAWLVGIVDAFRIGRAQARVAAAALTRQGDSTDK